MIRPHPVGWSWSLALALAALAALAVSAAGTVHGANLIANGSFESGPAPGDAMPVAAGSTQIAGWVVTRAAIDYCGTRWTAAEGARSLGLNGSAPGGIAQTFATTPGAQYTVRFWMAGDPGSTPVIKTARVTAAGQSKDFSADITGMWAWDPGWNSCTWAFIANTSSTTLEIYSTMAGDTGPAIDSVSVAYNGQVVGVEPSAEPALALSPGVPNPMRDASEIRFTLPRAMTARLSVLDLAGREVVVLAKGAFPPGTQRRTWDGRTAGGRAAPGVYIVQLSVEGRHLVRRLVVLR